VHSGIREIITINDRFDWFLGLMNGIQLRMMFDINGSFGKECFDV
jgi:hypothetical protein